MTAPTLNPVIVPVDGRRTPAWWTAVLSQQLASRQADIELMQRYVDGDHDNPKIEEKASQAFRRLLTLSKTNLSGLIVEAAAERMGVDGFRFGTDPEADVDAWEIWQRSDFDSESELLFTAALTAGRSFILVEPPQEGDRFPRLYAESATQMIVAYEPGRRSNRLAALKVFTDEWTGDRFATLYLPDSIHKLRAPGHGAILWDLRDPRLEGEANPLGTVPVFELRNRPRIDGSVRSEVADVISDQDACNHIALNALIAAEYAAFRQKYVTGMTVPRVQDPRFPDDPSKVIPVEPFDVAVNRLLVAEDPNARFGDFNPTDLVPYIKLYESRVEHMAAVSQTPVGFLHPVSNVSAEAMALSITGLINKVQRREKHYEQAIEPAMRLAFQAMGDERARQFNAQTIWKNPEIQSSAQVADAAVKLVGSDGKGVITYQTAQEKYLGMTQPERARDQQWREEGDAVAALSQILNPDAAVDTGLPV